MHIIPLLAVGEMPWFTIIGGAVAIVIVFFIFLGIWASRYTKVGSDEVSSFSATTQGCGPGRHGARSRLPRGQGRRPLCVARVEESEVLSLELLTIDVQENTRKSIPAKACR